MKRLVLGVVGILAFALIGCGVSKDKYTQLEREKQQLEERMARLQREKEGLASTMEDLEAENQRLAGERDRLRAAADENRARMDSMKQSQSSPAPASPQSLDAEYK